MPAERKPKIDLKARLGKKTVSRPAGGPSIPPPVGLPRPPGLPGFGSQPPSQRPSDPYAGVAAAAPKKAQAIKVEMSEEVVQAQKKGRKKVMVLAAITAGIGMVVGFGVGGMNERNNVAKSAVKGAALLREDVDKANIQAQALAETVKGIAAKLKESQFPDEEVNKLGGINIPFEGINLANKGMGRYKPVLVNLLIQFATKSAEANDQKDRLRRVLSGSKQALSDILAEKEKPRVHWLVSVEPGPLGPWAKMERAPEPFLLSSKEPVDGKPYQWPEQFTIKAGKEELKVDRYTKGDLSKGGDPQLVPVVPQTQGKVCPNDTVFVLMREVSKIGTILTGEKTPGHEKTGLIELGQQVVAELKKIGGGSA